VKTDLDSLLKCAVKTARITGKHALLNSGRRRDIHLKLPNDLKLKLDLECQALAIKSIHSCYPGHPVLGEEGDHTASSPIPDFTFAGASCPAITNPADILWIVDPIDGTLNFSHGLPIWCCSVAVAVKRKIVAGAVFAPALGQCYAARVGKPSTCNGVPIHVSNIKSLAETLIVTGMERDVIPGMPPFTLFNTVAARVQRARILGSAALDLCYVASGLADAYMEAGIYIWDIAAAGLIVRQAGGRFEQLARLENDRLCCLATNGHAHRTLRETVVSRLTAARSPSNDRSSSNSI